MDNNFENTQERGITNGHSSLLRRVGFLAAGIGLGSMVAYLITRALRTTPGPAAHLGENVVDDRGTGQAKAIRMLRNLRDRAFESSDEKLALALGRPVAEVTAWNVGHELIDDDVVMKARGIALNRGVYIE